MDFSSAAGQIGKTGNLLDMSIGAFSALIADGVVEEGRLISCQYCTLHIGRRAVRAASVSSSSRLKKPAYIRFLQEKACWLLIGRLAHPFHVLAVDPRPGQPHFSPDAWTSQTDS